MYGPVRDAQAPGPDFAADGPDDRLPPGPVLAALSQDVLDAGLGGLTDDELVGVLRSSRRLAAWQDGVELAAVAELDARRMRESARPKSSRASEHVSEELATALVLTSRSADLLLGLARDLSRLPLIMSALLAGRIDRARAAIFAAELAGLSDRAAQAVAMAFAGLAGAMTTGQRRAALRAMVLYLDPGAARHRAEPGRGRAGVAAGDPGTGAAGRERRQATVAADRRTRHRPRPGRCGRSRDARPVARGRVRGPAGRPGLGHPASGGRPRAACRGSRRHRLRELRRRLSRAESPERTRASGRAGSSRAAWAAGSSGLAGCADRDGSPDHARGHLARAGRPSW